jgi:hypothetical protein
MKPYLKRIGINAVAAGLIVLQIACSRQPSGSTSRPQSESPTAMQNPAPAASPTNKISVPAASPTQTPSPDGYVCASYGASPASFVPKTQEIICLFNSGWKKIQPELVETNEGFYALDSCGGHLLAGHSGGVSEYDGTKWAEHSFPGAASIVSIACDPAGGFWASDLVNIYHQQKGEPETYSQKSVFGVDTLILRVAVDPQGTAWALTYRMVSAFRDGKWAAIDQSKNTPIGERWFLGFAFDSKGTPWIYAWGALSFLEGTSLKERTVANYAMPQIDSLLIDREDRIWVHMQRTGFSVWDGDEWSTLLRKNRPEVSDLVFDMAEDESGRIWQATALGLTVVDGELWKTYRMDNSVIPVNFLSSVAVIGPGPLSMPEFAQKQTGSVRGTAFMDKKPAAETPVSLCMDEYLIYNAGMMTCDNQPFHYDGKTDGQGNFLFEQVPVGYYRLVPYFPAAMAFEWNEDPRLMENPILVEEGKTLDLGKIYWKKVFGPG